jgi:hypothetical protein
MTTTDDLCRVYDVTQYRVYESSDGQTTVFVNRQPDAWIRSDTTIELSR